MVIGHRSFSVLVFIYMFAAVSAVRAAEPLFPGPLHLVRRIDDPLAGHSVTLNEYCAGDRIVTVNGSLTTIVDYGRQEITEIDHRAATYSITRFADVVKTHTAATTSAVRSWKVTPMGVRASAAGRSLDAFEMVRSLPGGTQKIEAGIDRRIMLSRAAAEALVGAAYPGTRSAEHDALLSVAAGSADSAAASAEGVERYGLIAQQTMTYEQEGTIVVVRNSIVSTDSETVPPAAVLIDPGARRVESRLIRLDRELHDADRLPPKPNKP